MAEVIWSDAASEQLEGIIAYIDQFDPVAAEGIAARLTALAQSLLVFPNRGSPGLVAGTREAVMILPYVLTYDVDGDGDDGLVIVLDIRHGRQMPRRPQP